MIVACLTEVVTMQKISHKHLQHPEQSDIICFTSSWTMQAVRVQTLRRKRTRQWKPVHHIKTDNMSGSSALLKACHQRKGQRLHCTKTTSREHSVTFSYHYLWCKECKSTSTESRDLYQFNRLILLTVRERAATYSLIEYCHEEHVTVFEIRFHFINGLNPEREGNTILQYEQVVQGSCRATDFRFGGLRQKYWRIWTPCNR